MLVLRITLLVQNNIILILKNGYTHFQKNKKYNLKNYSLIAVLFIVGLMFVSVIKNETRNLQKNINAFQKSINILKVDLYQESLDYEIITSPENLTILAKEHLNINLVPYKRPQIQELKKAKLHIKNKNKNLKTGRFHFLYFQYYIIIFQIQI